MINDKVKKIIAEASKEERKEAKVLIDKCKCVMKNVYEMMEGEV